MSSFSSIKRRLTAIVRNRARGRPVVWTHPEERPPLTTLEARTNMDARRAELAAWALEEMGILRATDLRAPAPIPMANLLRVHPAEHLETVMEPATLARIYGVPQWDIPTEALLRGVRRICGGTLGAARAALKESAPQLHLSGGMHHAGRTRAGGFCPMNDIAVAIASLRHEGFTGPISIFDLDFHPPDGTADCLSLFTGVWLGSLSGASWGELPGPPPGMLDETVVSPGGPAYIGALKGLLGRAPPAALTFVLAGGDTAAADPVGNLGLSERELQERDLLLIDHLGGAPQVWLPAGGYGPRAWRVLAGTGIALFTGSNRPVPETLDPMSARFAQIGRSLRPQDLGEEPWITEADLADLLGNPPTRFPRLLGYYSAAGLELALARLGLLDAVSRLGYSDFTVEVDHAGQGDRMRLHGAARGTRHLLVEVVLEKVRSALILGDSTAEGEMLFVHWLTLRHPLAAFQAARPALPGQEVPGLGMAREAMSVLVRIAERLSLQAVALRPAHLHVAWAAHAVATFVDPVVEGQFRALRGQLSRHPLVALSQAADAGKLSYQGEAYVWPAAPMLAPVSLLWPPLGWLETVQTVERCSTFTWSGEQLPPPGPPTAGCLPPE
jgi:acetoin utilization deacetylase AcuC-like enzyme